MPKSVTERIRESSVRALRRLLGRRVYTIYAPCLQVAGPHLTEPSLSILTTDNDNENWVHKFIVFSCDYFETPNFALDYWQVHVSDEEMPDRIPVNSDRCLVAPCTINLYKAEPIDRIEIFSFDLSRNDGTRQEEVSYDQAIRFHSGERASFCVACQLNGPGIRTEVHFSE